MTPVFDNSVAPRSGHLKALDGVRGLAILMVLGSHLFWSNYTTGGHLIKLVGDTLRYGMFGVDLFFALSGFLITGILVDSLGGRGYFVKFYARRIVRIFPLYYGVLLALFLLTPLLSLHWHGMGWLFALYMQTLRPDLLGTFSPGSSIALNHFWSLAVEEQFYLLWPALVFCIRGRRRLLLATLSISGAALLLRLVLVGNGVSSIAIHMSTLTRADSLLLGGALALLYRSKAWPRLLQVAPYAFFAAAITVLLSLRHFGTEFSAQAPIPMVMRLWVDGVRYTVVAFGAVCLIAWSLRPASMCARLFESRILRFFGKYSYGIYVLHMLALSILLEKQRAVIEHLTHSKLLAVAGAGLSTLALSVAAAVVSFRFYEMPFLRLKRYFEYSPERKMPPNLRVMVPRRAAADLVSSEDRVRAVSRR